MGLFDDYTPTPVAPTSEQTAPAEVAPNKFGDYERKPEPAPVVPNKPFGELKPYTPSWREWIGNLGQDALIALGMKPYDAGHIAHGARDALMLSPAGSVVSALDVPHYAGQGDYKSAALNALAVIPASRGATRMPINFRDDPMAVFSKNPSAPTSQRLMNEGVSGFQGYRDLPVTYSGALGTQHVNDTRSVLNAGGQYRGTNPGTHEALDILAEKAKNKPFLTPADFDEFRLATSVASKKGESGAMTARTMLYDMLNRTGDTKMADAVANYGAGKRGSIVDEILTKSASRDDANKALATQIRSAVENQSKRLRGFSSAEVGALDTARQGSLPTRAAETAATALKGRVGGVNTGSLGILPQMGGAFWAGNAVGGPYVGAAAAAVPPAASWALQKGASAARRGAAEEASALVRQRSPLYTKMVAEDAANPSYFPVTPDQSSLMRNAITQQLLNLYGGR